MRWRGVMSGNKRMPRISVTVLLAVACVSLASTQLGFAGIGFIDEGHRAYAVVMLVPVALEALLLGLLPGLAMGLFAGLVMYGHATYLPLSYYELNFVTPLTSVVMLTISGLLFGVLFAFALRNNPRRAKRVVYIIIVCVFVSWLYSIGFIINVVVSIIVDAASKVGPDPTDAQMASVTADAAVLVDRFGEVGLQAWVDAGILSLCCIAFDYASYRAGKIEGGLGLRAQFSVWLSGVVLVVFMLTSALSFVVITQGQIEEASNDMESRVEYICLQLEDSDRRAQSLFSLLEGLGTDFNKLSNDEIDKVIDSITIDNLLKGYTRKEDGIIVVSSGTGSPEDMVLLSNDSLISKGQTLGDFMLNDTFGAIQKSVETDRAQRIVYDDANLQEVSEGDNDPVSRLSIGYVFSKQASDYLVTAIELSDMVFVNRTNVMMWTTLSTFILLLVVYILTYRLLSVLVVRRVDETNGVLARIGQGDLEARVDVRDTPEFKSLSNGINSTVDTLRGWIAEAETRMDAELATAKAIQKAALPGVYPPYPDILRFDIFGIMNAAREVGGDFYDYFLIGDDAGADSGKLGFIMADVSGKGVPAALFMMKAKTQIRDYLVSGMEVGEAVENANRQLCDGNEAGMFVTAWVGVYDYGTGHVDFANAGHNPPLLWQSGSWRWLKQKSGLPLGLFDGLPYTAYSVECQIGDQFLLYTDGVTEAMSVDGRLYGENRLEEVASMSYTMHPRDLVEAVRRDVAAHAEGAEQSDDITILALEVGVPPEVTTVLTMPAVVTELSNINEFIHTELDKRLCPLRAQNQLDIAVEELFVNVCRYAYPEATSDNPGLLHVSYTYSADPPSIAIDLIDEGIPFNPLAKPDAVTPEDVMEVPIGGLGILMAKKSVDEMRYERLDNSNVVTIVKKW